MQVYTTLGGAPHLLNRPGKKWLSTTSAFFTSHDYSTQSRGGLPRFFSHVLPSSQGNVVQVEGDEFLHMTKVLRLGVNSRLELFNGKGGLVEGCIQKIDRTGLDFVALKDPVQVHPHTPQWDVFAAFGTLKGGRADWLVEKCTELGASSISPLLTERSPAISENRVDRLQRVIVAATKQSHQGWRSASPLVVDGARRKTVVGEKTGVVIKKQFSSGTMKGGNLCENWLCPFNGSICYWAHHGCQRLHEMRLNPPIEVNSMLPLSKLSFIAAAEANPIISALDSSTIESRGSLIIGPEGDFTEKELRLITEAGATAVGLGPQRLRVETATIALLATVMLWSDSQQPPSLS